MVASRSPQDLAYAVHTATCTYLLDDDGVCEWIVSPQGIAPPHVKQAIGAQFVACLDLNEAGGLIGELRVGAMALLARYDGDRMVLLRTAEITNVDDRRGPADEDSTVRAGRRHALPSAVRPQLQQYGASVAGLPYPASPPPKLRFVQDLGSEQTVTVTMPRSHPVAGRRSLSSDSETPTHEAPRTPRKG